MARLFSGPRRGGCSRRAARRPTEPESRAATWNNLWGARSSEQRAAAQLPCFPGFGRRGLNLVLGCSWVCRVLLYALKLGPRKEEPCGCPGFPEGMVAAALGSKGCSEEEASFLEQTLEDLAEPTAGGRWPSCCCSCCSSPWTKGTCYSDPRLAEPRDVHF